MDATKTTFQKYPAYKHSGVDWLGEIPVGWEVKRLKFLIKRAFSGGTPATDKLEYWDGGIPWVSSVDVKNDFLSNTHREISEKGLFQSSSNLAPKGSIVFVTRSGILQHTFALSILNKEMAINQDIKCLILSSQISELYFLRLIQGNNSKILAETRQQAATVESVNMNSFFNLPIPVPPLPEQAAIGAFLDDKTAKIDRAIAQKEKMIALLKERKQIIIQQAVTKGLDPNANMKDSGVEWIGEVPEGWEVKRLRYLGFTQNGVSASGEYFGSGYPFVSYGDVYKNIELPEKVVGLANSSNEDRINYSIIEGDILFTRTSETIEEIGFSSTCLATIENSTFAGFLIRFRPKKGYLVPRFSKFYFSSLIHRSFFVKEMNLVTRASLSQELLKQLPVLLPPIQEQFAIAEHIETQSAKTDRAIALQEQQIAKLKELKATLIDGAVTGKIKVIGYEK